MTRRRLAVAVTVGVLAVAGCGDDGGGGGAGGSEEQGTTDGAKKAPTLDAAKGGNPARRNMVRPAITEQQYVGDFMLTKEIIEEYRPVPEAASEIRGGLWPVDPVARTDIDALYLHAAFAHRSGELVEQRSRRALQEQERALLGLRLGRARAAEVARPGLNCREEQMKIAGRTIH